MVVGNLLLLVWILATGLLGGLVSGLWMATWMLVLIVLASLVLWGGGLLWLVVAFVYLGGVFVLMVYVSGTDASSSKEGSGEKLVLVGAMVFAGVVLSSPTMEITDMGLGMLEGGGYGMVLLTAPTILIVMVLVNWVLYGHSGTLRSV
uniref:NADH dehydrogenase subunit 6 n=1 Tax=Centrorhynchus milvus TaxID=2594319 RepID=A0A515KZB2_9BILA|nr:NADH dehydrogenase subunit 6 [Centrorhynchus milvus]